MAGNGKPPVLVVVQLSGGNDFMNTLIPYNSPIYWDCRPVVNVPEDTIIPLNDELGFHPKTAPLKEMFDEGNVALIQGIGYPNSNRSHFRAMDIWHTCEPDTVSTTGWLGQAIQDLDPDGENVLTGVNLGRGLPRAMTAPGVPVASVGDLDGYGVMTSITDTQERDEALDIFKRMYGPAFGTGMVMDYLAQTGGDVLKGADRLAEAPVSSTRPMSSTPTTPSPSRSRTPPAYTSPTWARESSTSPTAATTLTPPRTLPSPSCSTSSRPA